MDVREKLVELLHNGVRCPGVIDNCNDCPHHSLEKPCDEFGATVDMLIAHGVTVQEWISVKDRLPKEHRLVLCRWKRGIGASYGFARYQHENDVWYVSNEGMPEVTHWMPLPQPPKGE